MAFNEFVTLSTILSDLPMVNGKKPIFSYGTHTDLLAFLKQKRKSGVAYYPLIWCETPVTVTGEVMVSGRFKFILATLTTSDLTNLKRTELRFVKTLDPLLDQVVNAIKLSSSTYVTDKESMSITRHFNYDTDTEHRSTDIWDVIVLEVDLKFNVNC